MQFELLDAIESQTFSEIHLQLYASPIRSRERSGSIKNGFITCNIGRIPKNNGCFNL